MTAQQDNGIPQVELERISKRLLNLYERIDEMDQLHVEIEQMIDHINHLEATRQIDSDTADEQRAKCKENLEELDVLLDEAHAILDEAVPMVANTKAN